MTVQGTGHCAKQGFESSDMGASNKQEVVWFQDVKRNNLRLNVSDDGVGSRCQDSSAQEPHGAQFALLTHVYKRRHKHYKESSGVIVAEDVDMGTHKAMATMEKQGIEKDLVLDSLEPRLDMKESFGVIEAEDVDKGIDMAIGTMERQGVENDLDPDSLRPRLNIKELSGVIEADDVDMGTAKESNEKDLGLDSGGPTLDIKQSSIESKDLSSEVAETLIQREPKGKTASNQSKRASRWERELAMLVSNEYPIGEEITDTVGMLVSNSFLLPPRKRKKIQERRGALGRVAESTARQNVATPDKLPLQRWREINVKSIDPNQLVGCKCKVYWPDDKDWYTGVINAYNHEVGKHHVNYDDGDEEELYLWKELVKVYLSEEELKTRNLSSGCESGEQKKLEIQEMAALATVFEDFQEEFSHGELVWAKIKGHPMWPAFVMDEKHASAFRLGTPARESTIAVQFFGSYDFARISVKQAISFSKGFCLKLYGKCKKVAFEQGLKEAERYLKEGKLPDAMSKLLEEVHDSTSNLVGLDFREEEGNFMGDDRFDLPTCPINLGDLQVLSLGKIVRDSEFFHNEHQIWTEGYSAIRKFPSIKDPGKCVGYRMEIVKDPLERSRPLFRVTIDDGDVVEGSTSSACWRQVFQRLETAKERLGLLVERRRPQANLGDSMFGLTDPQISKLIQTLPYARACFKFTGWLDKRATDKKEQLLPAGFKPVEIDWKHADRCSVCDHDEEYTNNLFLQCDRCRVLVHMHCYGESDPPNGHSWLCQLCRQNSLGQQPLCCLCPVQGGAMKRTTDRRWAHLTCAMWIPETCFVDVKHMEPIDGLKTINKERWKLTCSICKVPYGVCIQCSEPTCYTAYHVLCARSLGFALEILEDKSHKQRVTAEDFDDCVRFLSYCKRHSQPRVDKNSLAENLLSSEMESGYCPPRNSSGCARTEPYNGATRRGRQEPEARTAASVKRLYVVKLPYLVSGFSRQDHGESALAQKVAQVRHMQTSMRLSSIDARGILASKGNGNEVMTSVAEDGSSIWSITERYQQMCSSLKNRLTFGKSAIHGWGVFAKRNHRAGDMVIEYAGEIIRPIIADLRERSIYNTLVGAGTYMFRIDDGRVVDATREGSIAHLINHSCEPNCFSRVVSVCGEEHIIIFAKRDIEAREELSYDYRFTSKGERLECFCGARFCRGFVNVNDNDEETHRILVPRSEIVAWTPSAS